MLLHNTIPFTNPDNELFIGRWEGEDYLIQVGETRFFPSELSRHFAKHLIEKMLSKAKRGTSRIDRDILTEKLTKEILGEEMMTKTEMPQKTFKQIVEEHEAEVKAQLAEKERIKKAQKIEALKITEEINDF